MAWLIEARLDNAGQKIDSSGAQVGAASF